MSNVERMQCLVKDLAQAFPGLGLRFGYIGNLSFRWGDDRGWRVFTNRKDSTGRSVSYDLGDTQGLENACRLGARMNVVTFVAKLNSQGV